MGKPKVLFTASIAKHILRFHLPYLKWFQEQGYETHVACNGDEVIPFTDRQWQVPFIRTPFSKGHIKAYNVLKQIIERENYALVHCHTPMASLITRLASRSARKKGTRVLYTAHGFHFFKGAPLSYWLTFYPIELLASRWADAVITINAEDYNLISTKGSSTTDYYLVPGVGVDRKRFSSADAVTKRILREKFGFAAKDFIVVYAAEFIRRKNHRFLLKSLAPLIAAYPNIKLVFCGRGRREDGMKDLVNELKICQNVIFMGFRNDVHEIFQMSDIGVSTSRQEGLAVNLIEEMMCGLPVLAGRIRGHVEYVYPGETGYLYEIDDTSSFKQNFMKLYEEKDLTAKFSAKCMEIANMYETGQAVKAMAEIYSIYLPQPGSD